MNTIKLTINGAEVAAESGQSLLTAARENGFDVPSLCHDERVAVYGSCGVCCVEDEGRPKLLRSCSTLAAEGMKILTDSERVRKSRRTALELLLSDHRGDCRPPCALACPARTDCQGYVGHIANGETEAALRLIKENIPLPGSIGRVCPHPCEDACRRQLVEEPVSICSLKAHAADTGYRDGLALRTNPPIPAATGKTVAIVGGGPGGLSAAYFLAAMGHKATVFDAMPRMGGMLRYGIPEYRLPKAYLQQEIDAIAAMGVTLRNGVRLGRDITLEQLLADYGAVILAVGAWQSMSLGVKGEELSGVVGGIDFLREVIEGNAPDLRGKKVAVVGGGNTAMDACRTAVRLGAGAVYNIYRRTKNEMPAEQIEIAEAGEEGVIFKNLTNPNEIEGENGTVKAIRLQIMELGEPDASGRRAPVPVAGKEETVAADLVVIAIGQTLAPSGLEGIALTRRRTIEADESSFLTSIPGVFAIGDATNRGAGIAVEAIGEAHRAAVMADKFLRGEELIPAGEYLVKTEPAAADFADREKLPRAQMPHRSPEERKTNFGEVNLGFSGEAARREGSRCLECGCLDYYSCKLVDLAGRYAVEPEKLFGAEHRYTVAADDHPTIRRNPEKCILCGLCVRICDEVEKKTALGLVNRGFDTLVLPALGMRLCDTDCDSCGLCAEVCPTGAMMEISPGKKPVSR